MTPARQALSRNAIAAQLPAHELQRLAASAEYVTLARGLRLYEAGQTIDYVYFPADSLLALFAVVERKLMLEVGLAGPEGMLGAELGWGRETSAVRVLVQHAGAAARVSRAAFLQALRSSPALRRAAAQHAASLLEQAVQAAACSRFHPLAARLARVLLTTQDKLGAAAFHLTHEFLAQALGVRRVGVTKAAMRFAQDRLITYARGDITVLDRAGLMRFACSCYHAQADAGTG